MLCFFLMIILRAPLGCWPPAPRNPFSSGFFCPVIGVTLPSFIFPTKKTLMFRMPLTNVTFWDQNSPPDASKFGPG